MRWTSTAAAAALGPPRSGAPRVRRRGGAACQLLNWGLLVVAGAAAQRSPALPCASPPSSRPCPCRSAVRLDFGGLDGAARSRDARNREAWEREALAAIEDMRGELARLAPNLKARLCWVLAAGESPPVELLFGGAGRAGERQEVLAPVPCTASRCLHNPPTLPTNPALPFPALPCPPATHACTSQAVEQYEAIREKEREQLEELEAARREAKAAAEARPAWPPLHGRRWVLAASAVCALA